MISLGPHILVGSFFLASLVPVISQKLRNRFQLAAHLSLGFFYICCPSYFLDVTVKGEFNRLHLFLQAFTGAFHIGIGYFTFSTEDEKSKPEQHLIFARAVGAFFSLFTRLFACWHLSEKSTRGLLISQEFLYCAFLVEGTWFLSEVIRFLLNKRTTQDEVDKMVNRTTLWVEGKGTYYFENAYYIDAAVSLCMAMFHFAFPQLILKLVIKPEHTLDSHHIMWCRIYGCLCLIPAIASLQARYFTPFYQIRYLASRLITQVVIFLLNVFGHWILAIYSPNHISAFMINGFYMSFLFSAFYRLKNHHEEELEAEEVSTTTRIETRTVSKKTN